MITDHPFRPCWHKPDIALAIGGCVCPYGPLRCHIKGCGKKRSEHERSEEFRNKEKTVPTNGEDGDYW